MRASRSESVEELTDVEKEIDLFVRAQQQGRPEVVKKSRDVVKKLYENSWQAFFTKLEEKLQKLSPLFDELLSIPNPNPNRGGWQQTFHWLVHEHDVNSLGVIWQLKGYKGEAPTPEDRND